MKIASMNVSDHEARSFHDLLDAIDSIRGEAKALEFVAHELAMKAIALRVFVTEMDEKLAEEERREARASHAQERP